MIREPRAVYVRIWTTTKEAWITARALLQPRILLKLNVTRNSPTEMQRRKAGLLLLLLSVFVIPVGECLGGPLCSSMPKKACCTRARHCDMPTRAPSRKREGCPTSHPTALYLSVRADVRAVPPASSAHLRVDSPTANTARSAFGNFRTRTLASTFAGYSPLDKLALHSIFLI